AQVAGTGADSLLGWYRLDDTSEPPVFRLRRDEAVPPSVAQALVDFWEPFGVESESVTAAEVRRAVLEPGRPPTHGLFYFRGPCRVPRPRTPAPPPGRPGSSPSPATAPSPSRGWSGWARWSSRISGA